MNRGCIIFSFFLLTTSGLAQLPQRKANMGMLGKAVPNGIAVDTVYPGTTFATLGIIKGDIVQTVNDKAVTTLDVYNAIASTLRNGHEVKLTYQRNGKLLTATTTAIAKPFETSAIADIQYDWVKFRHGYLRAITRKPKGKDNVPCILLIPGYGCGSIENYINSYNGQLITEWLKNGYAVVTIEKSGVGDSDGCEPCSEVDLQTEIESFDEGYTYMEQLSFVDTSKLFIWGHSMGGTIAPEVAKRHRPKGVMVFACVFRPWNEFLPEMHRVQKPLLDNLTYQQTEKFVRAIQPVYAAFFNEKKSPKEIIESGRYAADAVKELGYQPGSNDLWGRHWRFWQQLDSINQAESWQQVNCPVLILHGGADYEQCSLLEPALIQRTVNEAHPKTATWITIPDIDHFMMKSSDWKEAAKNFKEQQYLKGNFNYRITEETVKWLINNKTIF